MRIHIVHRRTVQQAALLLAVSVACLALLRWPQAAATGVSRGLAVCGEVIIPSLFPFLVVTGVFIRSGLAGRVGKRLDKVTRRLFGLPGCCGAAVLIGMVGGYPAGGAAVRDLLQSGEISRSQANRLMRFCVNGGPAFLIGTVGARLLGSTYKGLLLYIAHVAASLLIGVCNRRQKEEEKSQNIPPIKNDLKHGKYFVKSVENACESVVSMCGFVVIFSAFLTLSEVSGLTGAVYSVMSMPFTLLGVSPMGVACLYPAFWEVSCGSVAAAGSGMDGMLLAFWLGAALGWGGISVHCQLGGILSEYKALGKGFWLARAWHALLGGLFSALLFRFLPMPTETVAATAVSASAFPAIRPVSVSVAASAAMLLLCGAFLSTVPRKT